MAQSTSVSESTAPEEMGNEAITSEFTPTNEATTETATSEAMLDVDSEVSDTNESHAVVVIESENAYTDAEKAKLLNEIDLLLDETLKDLNSGEALDEWDETTGGGQ